MQKKKSRIVSMRLDPVKPTPLSRKQTAELVALGKTRDDQIDYTDIPPTSAAFWENAVRGELYRPVKQQVSVRIDADVVAWLKAQGKGYHGRLNQILRSAMLSDLGRRPRSRAR